MPAQGLQTIPLSWPFTVWGLDILGPFPRVPGGYRYLYVAIDKFTKWVEVEAVRAIPAGSVVKFIKGIVSRFGVPNRIITDNGASRPGPSRRSSRPAAGAGWMSSSPCCGPSAPPQPSQREKLHSSSSTEPKLFSLTRSSIVRAIHLQARGVRPPLLQADEEERPVRVDSRG